MSQTTGEIIDRARTGSDKPTGFLGAAGVFGGFHSATDRDLIPGLIDCREAWWDELQITNCGTDLPFRGGGGLLAGTREL